MKLASYVDTLNLLGDESRLRLCALLRERELCVSDLVRVLGMAQPRVSTQLGRLRDAGFVRDRKQGAQTFYSLSLEALPKAARVLLEEETLAAEPTLKADRKRLAALDAERRGGLPDSFAGEMERHYSPGRTWESLALGFSALLSLGDVLDAGSGDGAVAQMIAKRCKSLTLVDASERMIEAARARLEAEPNVTTHVADVSSMPLRSSSFDTVLLFHTLAYVEHPPKVLEECARVLRASGRIVILSLAEHEHGDVTAPFGERHPGFSSRALRSMVTRAELSIVSSEIVSRETKKPHFEVVLTVAEKPKHAR